MFCLREEVDRLEGAGAVAVAGEQGDIAREGIRPAADVDDAARGHGGDGKSEAKRS